ncbi:hypothetical protein SERLA73DRAFT_184960 [Serpula lacrymans var. lacrymans S7.3]|uniref:Uncharacterized protein n=2 Tax=Serpula lacrymans var. lacrymans TaxID=341189 RepID=F8Q3U1_SERL3|nr:uncharacterized protein SERLADRAFT_473148 [Serpula lacrymans var. lacrymans S7.9]EGN96797.1 hypothetical protein SERLA73DRAFT_184960 [Serpula lacrymans var. lacrymans S7.3]EGO22396.1 hypothetical protein SERLADRAFT_473148 [Serpula lacrymans var. lacrymans S7.9]
MVTSVGHGRVNLVTYRLHVFCVQNDITERAIHRRTNSPSSPSFADAWLIYQESSQPQTEQPGSQSVH